jgi:biopolymer transport protein ExbD
MASPMMQLRIVSMDKVYGPVPMDTLVRLASGGRISADDMVRPVNSQTWLKVTEVPALAACLPQRAMPIDDQELEQEAAGGAESPRKRRETEDTEMDMTPMIDVTFQLLIFFMLTHAMMHPAPVEVPEAVHGRGVNVEGQQFVLIDETGKYYLGDFPSDENAVASLDALVQEVQRNAGEGSGRASMDVIVHAHKQTKHHYVRELIARLGGAKNIGKIMVGVQEAMQ